MTNPNKPGSWGGALSVYAHPKVLSMMFLGFSAGLPLALIFGNLSTWLTEIRIPTAIAGMFAWLSLTLALKVFFAPIIDVVNVPLLTRLLGHRRSWILVAQIGIAIGLFGMSSVNPHFHILWFAWFGLLIAFSAAAQDICIDAYRIEAVSNEYQAAMASTYQFGYRIALVVSSVGVLLISEFSDWDFAYFLMACLMLTNLITTLVIKEPQSKLARKSMPPSMVVQHLHSFGRIEEFVLVVILALFSIVFILALLVLLVVFPVFIPVLIWIYAKNRDKNLNEILRHWFLGTVVGPIVDFVYRYGFKIGMLALLLVLTYRVSDLFMGFSAHALYIDVGFSKFEIALYTKMFGVVMTFTGAFLGGVLVMRYGVMRILLLGAILVASTNLFFSALALTGKNLPMLITLIIGDNLSAGLATSAFIAYLSALVNRQYTATQYALFSSLMLIVGKLLQGTSGGIISGVGYPLFFVIATLTGIPTVLLILWLIKLKHDPKPPEDSTASSDKVSTEPTRSSRSRIILAFSVIPLLMLVMSILILFETGVWQFNNPDSRQYPVRGLIVDGKSGINWRKLQDFSWHGKTNQKLNYIYLQMDYNKTKDKLVVTKTETESSSLVVYVQSLLDYLERNPLNWHFAENSNLHYGAMYKFDLCVGGSEQANGIRHKIRHGNRLLPPVILLDLVGNCPRENQPPIKTMVMELKIFTKHLSQYYRKAPIILTTDKGYELFRDHWENMPLWIKSNARSPRQNVAAHWKHWQYTNKGLVEGVNGFAHLSLFRGSKDEFLRWGQNPY